MLSALSLLLGLGLVPPAPPASKGAIVGRVAPHFRLPATDGRTYTLSDFKGKQAVVLVWYPALETCT
jgi:peroxiredoxin Q/BCP